MLLRIVAVVIVLLMTATAIYAIGYALVWKLQMGLDWPLAIALLLLVAFLVAVIVLAIKYQRPRSEENARQSRDAS